MSNQVDRYVKAGKSTVIEVPDLRDEEVAFYLSSLVPQISAEEIKLAISKLGGRVSDLQSLVVRIKMGKSLTGT